MKYTAAVLSALALTPAALAQSSSAAASGSSSAAAPSGSGAAGGDFQAYLQQVLGALTAANLTSLVGVASSIANDTAGQALLQELAQGNKTVFAPSNEAFASVPESISSNTTALVEVLSYHILNNSYTPSGVAVATNHTIARTLLRGGQFMLPGNRSAPLVLERESANATSIRVVQGNNTQAQGPVAAANLQVYIVDEVLSLPANLSTIATAAVPALAGIIPAEILTALESTPGITVFAPNNDAISAAGAVIGTLNSTQIQDILLNHVINGTVAYSTTIASGQNLTSAGGQPFKFMTNSTGTFVTSGTSTAQIVATDIILNNGVVHLINGVLANTANNQTAADAAQSSQASVIATQTEATAPVTQTSNPSNTQGSGGGSSGSARPSGAASPAAPFGSTGTMLGGALGVIAAVAGGAFCSLLGVDTQSTTGIDLKSTAAS